MIKWLKADPLLREHYQFWTFGFATGAPLLYSAHLLRQDLRAARRRFDPDGRDLAFERTVLIGHIMGGTRGDVGTLNQALEYGGREFRRPRGTAPLRQHSDQAQRLENQADPVEP